jgi:uncharacterized protein
MSSDRDSRGEQPATTSCAPAAAGERAAICSLDEFGMQVPVEEPAAGPRHLCLVLAQACNLRCGYCYGVAGEYGSPGLMTREVALAAVDMLFGCGSPGDHWITLFGGEPLLNFEVLAAAVEHARARAAEAGRKVGFELNTNGTLITPEIADFLRGNEVEVVVSIDGDREVHDRTRRSASGGSYDAILERVSPWLEARDARLTALATVTHLDPDLERHVTHLLDVGFTRVAARPVATRDPAYALTRDDWEALKIGASALAARFIAAAERGELFGWQQMITGVRQVWRRETRGRRCGAGNLGLAVDAQGRLYPCHRFVGHQEFVWGDVWRGLSAADQEGFLAAAWVDRRAECAKCWARYLCGGRCCQVEALSVDGPEQAEGRCELTRHQIALAIDIHLRLRERFGDHWLGQLMLSEELARREAAP